MKQHPQAKVDENRFRALVASYGADLSRWPREEQDSAKELLATSSQAAMWLAEQKRLDELLDRVPDVAPSPALLRSIAEIPIRHGHSVGALWPFNRVRNWLALAGVAAAMGVLAGAAIFEEDPGEEASLDDLSVLALSVDVSEELLSMTRVTKGLALALAASVALNVFFVGFGAARLARRGPERRFGGVELGPRCEGCGRGAMPCSIRGAKRSTAHGKRFAKR